MFISLHSDSSPQGVVQYLTAYINYSRIELPSGLVGGLHASDNNKGTLRVARYVGSGEQPDGRAHHARGYRYSPGLPATYLAQLFATLTKAGLVGSVRGPGGGYVLGRPANEITAGEIVKTVEGPVVPVACVSNSSSCERVGRCTLRHLYAGLGEVIEGYLDGVTLADLVEMPVEPSRVGEAD